MGRLVDSDDVIKAIDAHTKDCSDVVLDDDISCILEEVPTAYDIEKVVAELEKASCWDDCYVVYLDRAIDIVKRGGAE